MMLPPRAAAPAWPLLATAPPAPWHAAHRAPGQQPAATVGLDDGADPRVLPPGGSASWAAWRPRAPATPAVAAAGQGSDEAFVPKAVYLQGWSRYGEEAMQLSREDCEALLAEVKAILHPSDQWMLSRSDVRMQRVRNARIVALVPDRETARHVSTVLREAVNAPHLTRNGRAITVRIQDGPMRRQLRATLARAMRVLEDMREGPISDKSMVWEVDRPDRIYVRFPVANGQDDMQSTGSPRRDLAATVALGARAPTWVMEGVLRCIPDATEEALRARF